ncbi:MAG TPA: DUF4190 domain-containing protein [Flavobacteriales bacterium]|nr:DUF4190 domain-containing protein [Flavobacteriales bacterium]
MWALLGVGLLMGCVGGRGTTRYGWLRLEGAPPRVAPVQEVPTEDHELLATTEADPAFVASTPPAPLTAPESDRGQQTPPDPLRTSPIVLLQDTDYYQVRPHPWNKVAVVSLPVTVIGVGLAIVLQSTLLLGIAGAVGFALALIGGRHARDHEERGRGFAMPAMIIGAVALFLTLLVMVTGS